MATKFKSFGLAHRVRVDTWRNNWMGRTVCDTEFVPKYANNYELYTAVAVFVDTLGDRLIAITGDSWGTEYKHGEIVVWYKE